MVIFHSYVNVYQRVDPDVTSRPSLPRRSWEILAAAATWIFQARQGSVHDHVSPDRISGYSSYKL